MLHVLKVKRCEKCLDFPIRDLKKPIELHLYPNTKGEVTAMLRTDAMRIPTPIMVMDLPWVLTSLGHKYRTLRNRHAKP